ncbi:MAG: hypothetical protein MUF18_02260 [Fimbriiglobus sp.]|nr:hypothetical protein [Fimbriiglobus sp.]
MRRVLAVLMAAAAVAPTGCNLLPSKPSPSPAIRGGTEKIARHDPQEFVGYLNRQAGYAQTLRYNDLDLKVSVPGQGFIPSLSNGMVVCGQPNNFRMTAGMAIGAKQLDVGANAAEMWMYVKMSQTPYLFCSHQEFPSVQDALPVKFEPSWVMQALGMATYDPNKPYRVEVDEKGRSYQLLYPDTTAGGQRVLKMTEFAADTMSGAAPQVRRHVVMTEDGKKVIAEAKIRKVSEQVVGTDTQKRPVVLQVPTELLLEWPQEQTKMDLVLGRISVNERMTAENLNDLFSKPARIGNATPVNLTDVLYGRGRGLPSR